MIVHPCGISFHCVSVFGSRFIWEVANTAASYRRIWPVRDLWQRRDLGVLQEKFTATVPRHGAVLLKVGKPR